MSLATGQQCKFQFGGSVDPLKHLPEGYTSLASLAQKTPVGMELPPPRVIPTKSSASIINPTTAEEPDIMDLSQALAQMSFNSRGNSPVSPKNNSTLNTLAPSFVDTGNVEPDLRPIDSFVTKENVVPKADANVSNTRHYQASLLVEKMDVYHKPLPSLYFEVAAGFVHKEPIPTERYVNP